MVVPILIILAWGAVGAAAGVASGYVIDRALGDGNYTRTEFLVDATTGAMGLSVLKAGSKVLGGIRYATGAVKLEKAEDAAQAIRAGFAAARQGVAEIYAVKGLDLAITSLDSPQAIKDAASGAGFIVASEILRPKTIQSTFKGRVSRGTFRKTWCRRHKTYDFC